jgi:phosphate/sulfate permease
MTGYLDPLIDISVALGKGVYSVGEDIVYGIERTAEGLGASGSARITEVGTENEQMANLLIEALKYPLEEKGTLYKAIEIILLEYYSKFPEETLRIIAEKAGIGVGFLAGRMLIGRQIVVSVTKRILLKIATSQGFKQISSKLGLSAVATATGVGAVVGVIMLQGMLQRASNGRKELEEWLPSISKKLKKEGNLDLLYFLIEGPMKKHLNAIKTAINSPKQFEDTAKIIYGQ